MKSNKGFSMVTLVVTIIVMLILLGLVYRIGMRYIFTSKEEEQHAIVSILSSAVEKRQNDNYSGIAGDKAYYSGYHIAEEDFEKVTALIEGETLEYEPGLWYIIDAKNAEDLGVKSADNYLLYDLENEKEDDKQKLAVVDYLTGKVFVINYDKTAVDARTLGKDGPNGHVHKPSVATCTNASVCEVCGEILTKALGHEYGYGPKSEEYPYGRYHPDDQMSSTPLHDSDVKCNVCNSYHPNTKMTSPTCTLDLKCERCGYIAKKATGHHYDTTTWASNAEGHYHPCDNIDPNNGEICGAAGNYENHQKQYTIIVGDIWQHSLSCPICNYSVEEECNTKTKPKDTNVHTIYCTQCLKEKDFVHDVIKYRYVDKNKHIVYCDTCKSDLREEEHIDTETPYGICDRCDGMMDVAKKPQVISVMMENKTPTGDGKYYAKTGDTVEIVMTTDLVLSTLPTFKVQGITIKAEDVSNPEPMKYVATFDTSEYAFNDSTLSFEISNIRSLWGVLASNATTTTDNNYVYYDNTLPVFDYLGD